MDCELIFGMIKSFRGAWCRYIYHRVTVWFPCYTSTYSLWWIVRWSDCSNKLLLQLNQLREVIMWYCVTSIWMKMILQIQIMYLPSSISLTKIYFDNMRRNMQNPSIIEKPLGAFIDSIFQTRDSDIYHSTEYLLFDTKMQGLTTTQKFFPLIRASSR